MMNVFSFKRWNSVVAFIILSVSASAQVSDYWMKDGGALFTLGIGYEVMPDTYSSKGFCLDFGVRFYTTNRLFYELTARWGTHDGDKEVMQDASFASIHDQRDCLIGAVGAGYEFFQTQNSLIDIYVKGLLGYGIRKDKYDDYRVGENGHTSITLGCEKSKKGLAAIAGIGLDVRFRQFTFTPSIDVIYVGRKFDTAFKVAVGIFY